MRVMHRILVWLASLLGVALLVVLLSAFAISRGWQRERLRSTAETLLAQELGEPVAIGGISGPLLPRLRVTQLRVGLAEAPTLAVDRLVLRIAWRRSLATRTLVIRSIEVRGAHLDLTRDARGGWRVPRWLAASRSAGAEDTGAPLPVHVERTALDELSARIAWQEPAGPAAIRATGSARLGPWSWPAAPGETLRGGLHARARGEGAAARWLEEASLGASFDGPRIALESLTVAGGERPPLRLAEPATLEIADGSLRVERLTLRGEGQALSLHGALTRERFDGLRLGLRDLDLTLAGELSGWSAAPGGRVTGTLTLDGPLRRPQGSVDLVWSEPRLAGWRGTRVTLRASGDGREIRLDTLAVEGGVGGPLRLARPARLRIRDGGLEVEDFALRSADQTLVANGGITPERFRALHLDVRSLDVALAGRLLGLAGRPGGVIGGELRLDGAFARPTGRIDLRWRDPQLAGWHGQEVALNARMESGQAQLAARLLHGGAPELSLEVAFPSGPLALWLRGEGTRPRLEGLPRGLDATLHSRALALGPFSPWLPASLDGLEGVLTGDLELAGGSAPRLRGHLELDDASLPLPGRQPLRDLHARLALAPAPEGVRVERLEAGAPGLSLDATGRLALRGPEALEVDVSAPDLAALAKTWELAEPLAGGLQAHASLSGDWVRPAIHAAVTWTQPVSGLGQAHRAELMLDSGERELVGRLAVHQRARVAAHGELHVPYGDAGLPGLARDFARRAVLELDAEDFDLASLSPLLPRRVRDLRGRADAHLVMRAGAARASLQGALRVRGGSVYVPVARQTFAPIEGSVHLRDDALAIDHLRVGTEGAHADVSGQVRLGTQERPARFDVGLALTRLPLARSRPLTTDVSGQLRLSGPPHALRLDGKVALSQTRVRLVDSADPSVREISVVSADVERQGRREMREQLRESSAFDRAAIDVTVEVPRNTWVRGRGADIDLAGTLRVEKSPGDVLRVSGDVAAVRGTYRFQGKRFELRRGTVSFAGTAELDPLIDIEAVHQVGNVTIVIALSGRASQPVVKLSSEPALAEEDVLSYLFFGRSTQELGSREPATNLDRAATAFAAGIALREASRLVEDVLPVDTIDVRIDETGRTGDVGVGKYVTRDLFVRYQRGFGESSADGVQIELRLSDGWSLETEASTDESAGANLIWSFDY